MSSVRLPAGELRVESEVIPVHYLSDIDGAWRFTDSHGHEHYCDYDAADHYPTLREVYQEPFYCQDCGETHTDLVDHLECRLCGETVRPRTTGPGTKYLRGPVSYYLDGQPISGERAAELLATLQR